MKPSIIKLGTIDCDMVETTPVVFKGKLYRFEYVRTRYWNNLTGVPYFRFVEWESGQSSSPFAVGYHLGNVMVEGDTLFVTATCCWGGERVDIFASNDMERWDFWNALNLPGYGIFNTSLCRAEDRYVLMYEVDRPPEAAGVKYTGLFAFSTDMRKWEPAPLECNYARDRYTAPHCLRYLDGWYYNFYLEKLSGSYEQYLVRSRDLINWEKSPFNPVLKPSIDDRKILNPNLTAEQRDKIATAVNINNSDIDMCEFRGKVIITYSWGDQHGTEFLAAAEYDGTLREFLSGWF